jgi:hypothetical protein
MASYLTNGRRNGVDQSTIINTKDFMVMISEGSGPFNIHAPGIFRFPACGPDEAMEGWKQAPGHMSPSKAINAKKRIWPCRGWESETDG